MQKFAGISAPIMPKDVEHNKALTGGNVLEQQSYSQFPQSFPHRYVKGLRGSAKIKNHLTQMNTLEELETILKDFEKELEGE